MASRLASERALNGLLDASAPAVPAASRRPARRAAFLLWLRRVHAWVGLWGALLGFAFGATGIVMNHRAILPVPLKKFEQHSIQLPLTAIPENPQALAAQLQRELNFAGKTTRIRVEPPRTVAWGGREVRQPESWQIWFDAPQRAARADYWVGDRHVKVEHLDANFIAMLTRLHQAVGVNAVWVLLTDSIAGCLILLSITGVLLWTRLHPGRFAWILIGLAPFAIAAGTAWVAR
jgi:hypothetical protein